MNEKDTWARGLAREILDRRQKEEKKQQLFAAGEEVRRDLAPALWSNLKEEVKAGVDALNLALGRDISIQYTLEDMDKLQLRIPSTSASISFRFDPQRLRVVIGEVNTSCDFDVAVVDGKAVWVSSQLGTMSSERIAKYILEGAGKFL